MDDLFPLGIATGVAFCDRREERRRLTRMVRDGRHAWLTAPRRYGKTSLIQQAILDLRRTRGLRLAAESVDLLLTYDRASFEQLLLDAVGRLSRQIVPKTTQLLAAAGQYFRTLRPEISLSADLSAGVRLTPSGSGTESLVSALLGLDQMASDRKVRVLMVMDEFQQLATLRDGMRLEAAVRHAVERARQVTYVFSGSHRHMLAQMFEDTSRPLYHLCERFAVERIPALEYERFLNEAAALRWQSRLDADALAAINTLTARHPYYVNRLCARLWREEQPPDAASITAVWGRFVDEERHRVSRELLDLSPNQRAVLQALAEEPTDQPRSKAFLTRTRLASASAGQAVAVLLEKDVLYTQHDGLLRVLDPAVQWYLWPAPSLPAEPSGEASR